MESYDCNKKNTYMKNLIKVRIATGLLAIAFGFFIPNQTHAQANFSKNYTFKNPNLLPIKKIKIMGNVEVTLVQEKNSPTHFINEGLQDVEFSQSKDKLIIKPLGENTRAKVKLYISDIYRIEGWGDARIITEEVLKGDNLQIILNDNAYADINSITESIYTICRGSSRLTLHGDSKELISENSKLSSILLKNFNAAKTQIMQGNQLAKL